MITLKTRQDINKEQQETQNQVIQEVTNSIFLQKKSMPAKNVFVLNDIKDVPKDLQDCVSRAEDGGFYIDNREVQDNGHREYVPAGYTIKFENDKTLPHGKNLWGMTPEEAAKRFETKDGVLYTKPSPNEAGIVGEAMPKWVEEFHIDLRKEGDKYVFDSEFGKQECNPGDYLMNYGNGYIYALGRDLDSFKEYDVCTEQGKIVDDLQKFDSSFHQAKDADKSLKPGDFYNDTVSRAMEVPVSAPQTESKPSLLERLKAQVDQVAIDKAGINREEEEVLSY